MSNIFSFTLPAGSGFSVYATSAGGAYNYATLSMSRGSSSVSYPTIEPGKPAREIRAVFSDTQITVAGYAGEARPSRVLASRDGNIMTIRFDDAYGNDSDFNDLIVIIETFEAYKIKSLAKLSSIDSPDALYYLSLLPGLDNLERFITKLDAGEVITTKDYSDLPLISSRLNPEERKLFNSDPIVGARVLIEAKRATNEAEIRYTTAVLHNGNGDAFRHLYWNFLMTTNYAIGEITAEKWGVAHESPMDSPPLERTMDLYNNQCGRKLGVESAESDIKALIDFIRGGGCRILKNGALDKSSRNGEV